MANNRTVTLANGERVQLRCWLPGRYRFRLSRTEFAHIVGEGKNWKASVRIIGTGSVVRWLGIWDTLREAVAESVDYKKGIPHD